MIDAVCTIGCGVAWCSNFLWGWPLLLLFGISIIYATIATRAVQFREWSTSWRLLLAHRGEHPVGTLTSFQAFLNTLSSSMGNGSLAGMATALYAGGPGVAFWIFFIGFFTLALRAVEVFASTAYLQRVAGVMRGGPFVFLQRVPGGTILPQLYAFCCLVTVFVAGCAMQCNSMSVGLQRLILLRQMQPDIALAMPRGYGGQVGPLVSILLFFGVFYAVMGGARRIIRLSEYIIPLKVLLFFTATVWILLVYWQAIPAAISTILHEAFQVRAGVGLLHGYTMWTALRFGLARSLSATEAGLGTAGILFGETETKRPALSALMSMPALFLSNHLICCSLIVVLMVTGAWQSGLNGTAMTCAAYEAVFGSWGAVLVTLLSLSFGLGVLIAYVLIGRACWQFVFAGRALWLFNALFCLSALCGALVDVALVWQAVDLANGMMLLINLYGLIYLMPQLGTSLCHALEKEKQTI